MAQLIKLYDYISRYELNAYRYSSQFIRLKKQQWDKVSRAWESDTFYSVMKVSESPALQHEDETEKRSIFKKIKNRFSKEELESPVIKPLINDAILADEDLQFQFTTIPKTIDDLKHLFLDYIFRFQVRWASSTLREISSVEKSVYRDRVLKYFVQRIPDQYLLLYRPVFQLKNAPVELDLIMIGTTEVYCITLVEQLDETVFTGSKEKFWVARKGNHEKKMLSPLLSLNRTGTVVEKLISAQQVDIPVKKLMISRNGYIDYPFAPYDITILDKRTYDEWFQRLRKSSAPLKHTQLKAAQVLLSHCLTNSYYRKEWDEESSND
ncbi:NERD domain-containing protein [Metabacillus bambusae]|uniref:NERD domain-containing protein n=1 Tax=Metabacillus bambusae TaxID=2795218 RepID=A0ABS3N587_9BACI|nr:NERD domain-containing protein [Metabacillus bambusae]MBO1513190.1 NERD domain-containing protein [Metabacillus bambusae]